MVQGWRTADIEQPEANRIAVEWFDAKLKAVSAEMHGYSCISMRDKGHLMAAADGLHLSCECLVGHLLHIFLAQDDSRGMCGGNPLKAR